MIVRPSDGKNFMTGIPRAVKHHKAFNSTKDGLPLTAFMITSQNQSASSLYCFLVLRKTSTNEQRSFEIACELLPNFAEIQQTNRVKRDLLILPRKHCYDWF